MVKLFSAVGCVVVMATVSAFNAMGANYYWKSNGEGGWNSPKRWGVGSVDGPEGVPSGSDVVRINGVTAEINDEDAALVANLREAVLGSKARVVLNITTNAALAICFEGSTSTIIKMCDSRVYLSSANYATGFQLYGGNVVVSNGVLKMGKQYVPYPSTFEVCKDGVLELPDLSEYYVAGLSGEGIVRNGGTQAMQLKFINSIFAPGQAARQYLLAQPPYVFGGTFTGNPDSSSGTLGIVAGGQVTAGGTSRFFGPYEQYFTNKNVTDSGLRTPRFHSGIFGLAAVGGSDSGESSIGNYDTLSYFSDTLNAEDETGIMYVGEVGASTKRGLDLFYKKLGSIAVFDAGANGGLTFENTSSSAWRNLSNYERTVNYGTVSRLVLRGSNTSDCVVKADIRDWTTNATTALIKRGSGGWKLSGSKGFAGPVFVEEGALRFDAMADGGAGSSLGTATMLYTNWLGNASYETTAVPFAMSVGNGNVQIGDDVATLEYAGEANGAGKGRPLAVNGAGRVSGGEASIRLCGASAAANGVNTLVLDGSGDDNLYSDATNGVGQLRIVKEGTGTWQLSGDVILGGGLEVRVGKVKVSNRYSWYRFNMKQAQGVKPGVDLWFGFKLFGLWDADGNLISNGIVGHDVDGATATLGVGETALSLATSKYTSSTSARAWTTGAMKYSSVADPLNPSAGSLFRMYVNGATSANVLPREADESTWVRAVIRLPDGASPAACYDMRAEEHETGDGQYYELKSFGMDASADGLNWTEVSSVSDFSGFGNAGRWYSTGNSTRTNADGFRLSGTGRDAAKTVSVSAVRVDKDAELELEPEADVEVGCVEYDVAAGGGKITGKLTLSAGGTLAVSGTVQKGKALVLPMDLSAVEGLEHVSEWSVRINGEESSRWTASASPSGFKLQPHGLVMVIR